MATPLSATIDIDAPPADVWAIVSDLKRMSEWSPQCRSMRVLGGSVKEGTRTFNINRRGPLFWPTSSKVIRFEPQRAIAFRVLENNTIWSYVLEATDTGTRVVERRVAPGGTTKVSQFLIGAAFGGASSFEEELKQGMASTLAKIKKEAERVSA